jgi:hypothetical protein
MEVDSTDALNPGSRDVRLSIRLKTTGKPDWDLIRKGYSAGSGSLYKVEVPVDRAGERSSHRGLHDGAGRPGPVRLAAAHGSPARTP